MPWLVRIALISSLLAGLWLLSAEASAQLTSADRALATDLFKRGRKALLASAYDEACPLLEESQRLDPAGGTLLNLALCHEQSGRTASAWSEFHDALSQARRERREDRVKYASQHIEALEPRLARLLIELAPEAAALAGLRIERDGSELGSSALGAAMPVDPGEHSVRASAPGYQTSEQQVSIREPGETQRVLVAMLSPVPVAPPVAEPELVAPQPAPLLVEPVQKSERTSQRPSRLKRAAIASFALALVSAALATGFGVRAITLRDQAEANCSEGRCSPEAYEHNDRAGRYADTSTALSVVAGAGVASGAILWWRSSVP